MAYDVNAGKD